MKKQLLFFLILVFCITACSPQPAQVTITSAPTECCAKVTVTLTPTETPISTPTSTPAEQVTPTEAAPTPEQLWQKQVEKWGIDPAGVTSGTDADGKFVVTENEKGKVIYKDGSLDVDFFAKLIGDSGNCKITQWSGSRVGLVLPNDLRKYTDEYGQSLTDYYLKLVKIRSIRGSGMLFQVYYLGNKCWAQYYYTTRDQSHVWFFWKDSNGMPLYEQVFLTGW